MNLVKAAKDHKCKHGCDILKGDQYYPQRRGKAICFYHGYKPKQLSKFKSWLLRLSLQIQRS